jgi:hypothetical protein
MRHQRGDTNITTEFIEAAAQNTLYGKDMMIFVLEQGRRNAQITRAVVQAALDNKGCGKEVLQVLYEKRGDAVVAAAAGGHQSTMTSFLEQQVDKIILTENVVQAAAENHWHGWMVLCSFLRQPISNFEITKAALDMARHTMREQAIMMRQQARSISWTGKVTWNPATWESWKSHNTSYFVTDDFPTEPTEYLRLDRSWLPKFDETWEPWLSKGKNPLQCVDKVHSTKRNIRYAINMDEYSRRD